MLLTATVLVGLITALVATKQRVSHMFIAATVVLLVGGELDTQTVLSHVTNSGIVTLVLLLLAAIVLERTVLLSFLAKHIAHSKYLPSLIKMGALSAIASSVLNNTAVVATMMRAVMKSQLHAPQRLLIPLSYFSILGGTLTLVGTSTNLVVSGLVTAQGGPNIAIFDFLPIGAALVAGCGAVVMVVSRWLPQQTTDESLESQYFIEAAVEQNSPLIGKTVIKNGLRALDGLFLAEIVRGNSLISPVKPDDVIQANDKLLFSGDVRRVHQITALPGLHTFNKGDLPATNLREVLVSPESILIGKTLKQVGFRARFDAAVIGLSREGKTVSGKLGNNPIQSGDKLMLAVGPDFERRQNISRNFFLLSDYKTFQPLSVVQNTAAIAGFLAAIALGALGIMSLIESLMLYLVLMVGSKVADSSQLRRRFPFELLTILVCALSLASAVQSSGLAQSVTQSFLSHINGVPTVAVLLGLILLTVLLTETMTNTAAAALMVPIALSIADGLQLNAMPWLMAVAYGASACFISPFGYQTNLMVMSAGEYRPADFIRVGWPVTLVYIAIVTVLIPIVFPFDSV